MGMHHIDVRMEKDVYDVNNAIADENARHLKDARNSGLRSAWRYWLGKDCAY